MLLVSLIWGFNFSITKGVFRPVSPLAFTAVRFTLASAAAVAAGALVEGPAPLPRGALAG